MAKYRVTLECNLVVEAADKKAAIEAARKKFDFDKALRRVEFSACPHTPRCSNAPYKGLPYCCLAPGEEIDR